MAETIDYNAFKDALLNLLNPSNVEGFLACVSPYTSADCAEGPKTALIHVKFAEDKPQVASLARFLWGQCMYYALPRKKFQAFQAAIQEDFSIVARAHRAVKDAFIEFRAKNPSRASEVGEVLAYCMAQTYLKAPQMAAKMALKTSANMPVHGLDGIHALWENEALTLYFLESKLAKSAVSGADDYAESVAGFLKNEKQYLREYEIVSDLGNLDTLEGKAREAALNFFDIHSKPELPRRERSVGVICYSEKRLFADTIPVSDGPVDLHEKHFASNYLTELEHHRLAVKTRLEKHGADINKSIVFFIAVPDVNELRKAFYEAMGGLYDNLIVAGEGR
ncbi:HamA C-terminal domain-containing protein [Brucella anthropi]|uniref:HamA C-terminal domain-containing protein n=1 Tax=Brucella anthropi TaxID=529 RepID=UPI0021661206|nr:DUF1837 domain-containing protein [Brucella anthropi]UVV70951.1 DUF1837 domain-containing protein [Brucella anthropi]